MKHTKENIIHLENYREINKDGTIAKVFTGRYRGEDVRNASNIDKIEESYDEVKVVIPDNIY